MKFTVLAALVGLTAGLAGGGRLGRLRGMRPRWWLLAVAWAGVFLVVARTDVPGGFGLLVAGHVLLVVFAVVNLRRVPGIWMVLLGASCNLMVIGLDHGTPYSVAAARSAGIDALHPHERFTATPISHPERPDDRLTVLGDVIPIVPLHEILSFGDLFLAVGAALILFHGTLRVPRAAVAKAPAATSDPPAGATRVGGRDVRPGIDTGIETDIGTVGELFWRTRAEVFGLETPDTPEWLARGPAVHDPPDPPDPAGADPPDAPEWLAGAPVVSDPAGADPADADPALRSAPGPGS